MHQQNNILKPILSWLLGYMRWTQLTPMLLLWGGGVLMLFALTFVNFQDQTFSALESVMEWLIKLPLVGDHIAAMIPDESSDTRMTTDDFKSFLLSAWAVLSLVLMLGGMALSAVFGPFKPWTLKRKLLLTGAACAVLLAGMAFNYYAAPHNFNGKASAWVLNFSLIALLVFVVSAYCLSISHFLGFLNKTLLADELKGASKENTL